MAKETGPPTGPEGPTAKRARHCERTSALFSQLKRHMHACLHERSQRDVRERALSRAIAEQFPLTFPTEGTQQRDAHASSPSAEQYTSTRAGSSPCVDPTTTKRSKITPTPPPTKLISQTTDLIPESLPTKFSDLSSQSVATVAVAAAHVN